METGINLFTTVDYVWAIFALLFLIGGLLRGFFAEFSAILLWCAAVFLGVLYAPSLRVLLSPYFQEETICTLISFILIVLGVWLVGALLLKLIFLFFGAEKSFLSRLLGGILGLIKGAIIIFLVIFVIANTAWSQSVWFQHSVVVDQVKQPLQWLQQQVFQETSNQVTTKN